MFNQEEMFELEELANDAIFAWRKRLQHAQGKIDLNIPGNDARNTVCECTVEECKEELDKALTWYYKLAKMTDEMTNV